MSSHTTEDGKKLSSSEIMELNFTDFARVAILNEANVSACILCGVEISGRQSLVCKLHAAQVVFTILFATHLSLVPNFCLG